MIESAVRKTYILDISRITFVHVVLWVPLFSQAFHIHHFNKNEIFKFICILHHLHSQITITLRQKICMSKYLENILTKTNK